MSITVREAGPDDVPELIGLIAAHAAFERDEASITQEALQAILRDASPQIRIIVAATPSGLVAYAALTTDFSLWRGRRWAHLDCLFVEEQHRGHAIGRTLFSAAKTLARSMGADRMEWQTPSWNAPAIRFYAKHGAVGHGKMRFSTMV